MQIIVSKNRVVFSTAPSISPKVRQDHNQNCLFSKRTVKAVQKLLSTQLERESIQHKKPITFCCSSPCTRHQRVSSLSVLDGSRGVESNVQLILCSITTHIPLTVYTITILNFTRQYTIFVRHFVPPFLFGHQFGDEPKRSTEVIVITRPHCSHDPTCPNYEQYCHQCLMKCKPFREINELKSGFDTSQKPMLNPSSLEMFQDLWNRTYSDSSKTSHHQVLLMKRYVQVL